MDYAKFFQTHPPRCIAGFNAQPTELPSVELDGHASASDVEFEIPPGVTVDAPELFNPVFSLQCTCGGLDHFVHGYVWTNPDFNNVVVFLSPIVLECSTCGKKTDLLDTDVHGYDAELGHGSATARAKGDRAVFECPECGRQPLEVFARFEYPDDLFDDDFPEAKGREQDLFTWFSLHGRCTECAQMLAVTDFECA